MNQIRVTVISAYNLPKKAGLLDKTDPYVEVQVGAQKHRTTTKKDAGSEAQYNEALTFTYNGEPHLAVHVYDDEKRKDDLIGSGRLELTHSILHQGWRGAINIYNAKEQPKGEVLIHLQSH
eukprot:Gregarina_sp_Poly_1__8590@NODE_50_length_17596_cov_118_903303_g43_i0_p13_GENE_NODE_50_length_17596_cov_118_903303_g43_i0NODE_50_length_17596_cov_118_903303_g43_i0_p13_ORF_typecomplete_len121_score12_77C2/PF00168_30/2_7e18_NODE_50_length_17596_cov_118_903303_g43_i063166678